MTKAFFAAVLHSCGLTHRELFLYDEYATKKSLDFFSPSVISLQESGIPLEKAQKVSSKLLSFSSSRLEGLLSSKNISLVLHSDSAYPQGLLSGALRPFLLYVRGALPPSSQPLLACVGSRKHSPQAKKNIETLLVPIIQQGWGVVSGGAYGVDALAHQIALDANGYTMAVFGTGVDVFYPATHRTLFERIIASGGACISHFPLATKPEPYNFPQRNALIAWITKGTLIAEAGLESGTLITASLALEYNREVFVCPGNMLDSYFFGSNKLLTSGGGKIVWDASDILSEYASTSPQQTSLFSNKEDQLETDLEMRIYACLQQRSKNASELCEALDIDASELLLALTLLEMREIITQSAGNYLLS